MKPRTKYLVNPKLQLSIVGIAVLISVCSFFILEVFFLQYWSEITANLKVAGIGDDHPLAKYLLLQQDRLQKVVVAVGIISAFVNVVVLAWFSQRIAGPIYRLHLSMQSLLAGTQNSEIKVRKNDFFKDTAALLEKIRQRGIRD